MKWLALLCLGGVASAGPKHSPDKYAAAASAEFDKALAAEHAGHLNLALDHYKNAFEISPHADVVFNEASVFDRMDYDHEAIAAYELYLLLAPNAPDRSQVEAAIRRIATKSQASELRASNLDLADAYVFVDGEIVAKPGQIKAPSTTITIGHGPHFVAAVTAISFAGEQLTTKTSIVERSRNLAGKPRIDGNVVVEMPYMYHVRIDGKEITGNQRVAVTPGMQVLAVFDDKHECPPVKVDAPRDGSIAFVQLLEDELPEVVQSDADLGRCRRLTVKQHHLVFAK